MRKISAALLAAAVCLALACLPAAAAGASYTITVPVLPAGENVGTAEGGGVFAAGETVTLKAFPAEGYVFSEWSEGGAAVSTAPSFSFPAERDRTIAAVFQSSPDSGKVLVSAQAEPEEGGTVTGTGPAAKGSTVSLHASANPGWKFKRWTAGESLLSEDTVLTLKADADTAVTAVFAEDDAPPAGKLWLQASVYPEGAGSVEGGGYYSEGETVRLTQTAAAGYRFDHWQENGYRMGSSETYSVKMTSDRKVTAVFAEDSSTAPSGGNAGGDAPEAGTGAAITLQASPEGAGTLSGGGNYRIGDTAVLSASPAPGYRFYGWRTNGRVVSTSATFRVPVEKSAWYTAVFLASTNIEALKIEGLPANNELTVAQEARLSVSTTPAGASGTVTWKSSDESVLSVTSGGTIRGMKAGTAAVTASCGTASDRAVITVYDDAIKDTPSQNTPQSPQEPESPGQAPGTPQTHISTAAITNLPARLRLTTVYGGTTFADVRAALVPESSTDSLSWASENPEVATADPAGDGLGTRISAVSDGTTRIIAKSGSVTHAIEVEVSSSKYSADNVMPVPTSPDSFGIRVWGLAANPAFAQAGPVDHISVFAWSDPEQRDIQAVRAVRSGNAWEAVFSVNGTAFFSKASKIQYHVYASESADSDECLLAAGSYKAVNTSSAGKKSTVYSAYAADLGFITPASTTGLAAGTTGQARRLEGVRASSNVEGVSINTEVHAADIGWMPVAEDGEYAGTMGQCRQIEAVRFTLTGENAGQYYARYRVHCADTGWTDWTLSTSAPGAFAGTVGEARRIEAVQLQILKRQ